MVNGNPDPGRKLGADLVKIECRNETNNCIGHPGAYSGHGSVFGQFGADEPVQTALDPLNHAGPDQLNKLVVGNSQFFNLARTKKGPKAGAVKAIFVESHCHHSLFFKIVGILIMNADIIQNF